MTKKRWSLRLSKIVSNLTHSCFLFILAHSAKLEATTKSRRVVFPLAFSPISLSLFLAFRSARDPAGSRGYSPLLPGRFFLCQPPQLRYLHLHRCVPPLLSADSIEVARRRRFSSPSFSFHPRLAGPWAASIKRRAPDSSSLFPGTQICIRR